MPEPLSHSFTKSERLCGKSSISALLAGGHWASTEHLRYCWMSYSYDHNELDTHPNRILISVSKKYFKRAVKRNLLKRRIREAYRLNKHILKCEGICFMVSYTTREILDFASIESEMRSLLSRISKHASK